jgi:hypothetical protein
MRKRTAAIAFTLGELRSIGERLVTGSWMRPAKPMPVTEALSIMAEATSMLVAQGAESVIRRLRESLAAQIPPGYGDDDD